MATSNYRVKHLVNFYFSLSRSPSLYYVSLHANNDIIRRSIVISGQVVALSLICGAEVQNYQSSRSQISLISNYTSRDPVSLLAPFSHFTIDTVPLRHSFVLSHISLALSLLCHCFSFGGPLWANSKPKQKRSYARCLSPHRFFIFWPPIKVLVKNDL